VVSPFTFSGWVWSQEIAKLLIAKGANINTIDVNGETAMDRAVSEGKKETADLLRKHGGKTGEELKAEGK
jgi:ankyrin repeat protein